MKINDAMKATGKTEDDREPLYYVSEDEEGRLYWFEKSTNRKCHPVIASDIFRNAWLPYSEAKNIVPQKAGELWELNGRRYYFTVTCGSIIKLRSDTDVVYHTTGSLGETAIHNRNGWTRLFPQVKIDE